MKIILKITLIAVVLILASCSNNETPRDQLPPITQTGENTFGCLVNGQVFLPKDGSPNTTPGGGIPRGLRVIIATSYTSITARNQNMYVYIYIPENTPQEITYNFQTSTGLTGIGNESHCFAVVNGAFYLSYIDSGTITFTKVDDNIGIIAGTFSLKLKNRDNENDILEITEGRFDI